MTTGFKNKLSKKELEVALVRKYLQHGAIECLNIQSVCDDYITPDVAVICKVDGPRLRVGVEVCRYMVDDLGLRKRSLSEQIDEHLSPMLASDSSLRDCAVQLFFDERNLPRPSKTREIAEEVCRFVRGKASVLADGRSSFFSRYGALPSDPGDFHGFPLLLRHFTRVRLCRPGVIGPMSLKYNSAALVGVIADKVVQIVTEKAEQLSKSKYDLTLLDQVWLLICAGVAVPSESAGHEEQGREDLASERIHDVAIGSGFDRVIFWESGQAWDMHLK